MSESSIRQGRDYIYQAYTGNKEAFQNAITEAKNRLTEFEKGRQNYDANVKNLFFSRITCKFIHSDAQQNYSTKDISEFGTINLLTVINNFSLQIANGDLEKKAAIADYLFHKCFKKKQEDAEELLKEPPPYFKPYEKMSKLLDKLKDGRYLSKAEKENRQRDADAILIKEKESKLEDLEKELALRKNPDLSKIVAEFDKNIKAILGAVTLKEKETLSPYGQKTVQEVRNVYEELEKLIKEGNDLSSYNTATIKNGFWDYIPQSRDFKASLEAYQKSLNTESLEKSIKEKQKEINKLKGIAEEEVPPAPTSNAAASSKTSEPKLPQVKVITPPAGPKAEDVEAEKPKVPPTIPDSVKPTDEPTVGTPEPKLPQIKVTTPPAAPKTEDVTEAKKPQAPPTIPDSVKPTDEPTVGTPEPKLPQIKVTTPPAAPKTEDVTEAKKPLAPSTTPISTAPTAAEEIRKPQEPKAETPKAVPNQPKNAFLRAWFAFSGWIANLWKRIFG